MLTKYKIFLLIFFIWTLIFFVYDPFKVFPKADVFTKAATGNSTTQRSFNVLDRKSSYIVSPTKNTSYPNLNEGFLNTLYEKENNRQYLSLTNEGVEFFKSSRKGHKKLWEKEPYFSRRKKIQTRCSNLSLHRRIDLARMIYDDHHHSIMCVVPKAACTTWKQYFWYLIGRESNSSAIDKINRNYVLLGKGSQMPLLSRLPKLEAMKRLASYTTYFVTRHPFERLVSAHSSKFTNRSIKNRYREGIGKRVAINYADKFINGLNYVERNKSFQLIRDGAFNRLNEDQQNVALKYVDAMNTGRISFELFATYIASKDLHFRKYDVHWRPQVALCNPCAVNYDFVIEFENLAKDSNHLLKYVQRNDPESKKVFFDESIKHLIDKSKALKAFSKLNKQVINRLSLIYEEDFNIFNYTYK